MTYWIYFLMWHRPNCYNFDLVLYGLPLPFICSCLVARWITCNATLTFFFCWHITYIEWFHDICGNFKVCAIRGRFASLVLTWVIAIDSSMFEAFFWEFLMPQRRIIIITLNIEQNVRICVWNDYMKFSRCKTSFFVAQKRHILYRIFYTS